ncbi:DRTGG domain-containing protein [Halarsenatibacter silvermanii]|uniref:DRTGG domain-containing protein n=1 Tax=Halarsenatibacter silvermanii TaxID=321763 RepID=A0A1G9QMQ1_9FIRM|nr:DRTGG domain-containing protein [Halarsenatibacter silvermanii]SDM12101.1 DRTGG domain-containing protein [Halarsenatibacter silvermanii]
MLTIRVKDLVQKLNLEVVVKSDLEQEVTDGYCGDLLSNVMSELTAGSLWITIQGHQNAAAVALLAEAAGIIIAENFSISDDMKKRAREKGINVLRSPENAYHLSGKLYELGVGREEKQDI